MSDIQVGDSVSVPGYALGVVLSVWGAYASVRFPNGSRHVPLSQITSLAARVRRIKEEQAKEDGRRKVEQDLERKRLKTAARDEAIAELQTAMGMDFLGVDDLYQLKFSDTLSQSDFFHAKSSFARQWIAAHSNQAGSNANLPDAEQSAAISSIHGNIQVVARAGSGKTTTLVSRSMFLLKHCGVAASELLLLAFNRKAAIEIRKKLLLRLVPEASEEIQREIDKAQKHAKGDRRPRADVDAQAVEAVAEKFSGRLPHVMTFHALAYAIVHPQGQVLFDGQDSDTLGLSRAVQGVIDEFLQRSMTRDRIQELMMDHFREDWDRIVAGGFNLGKEDMLALKRSLPRETLSGELVKSRGEKVIADFLFEHGVPYKYERNHWWSGVNYKPDFTIFTEEKAGVVIEYFGMAGDEKYDRLTKEKKKYWADKKGWSLVSLYPWDLAGDGSFEEKLTAELEGRGVRFRRLGEEEIWALVKHRAVDRFARAVTSFIGRCRKKSWSAEDLAEQVIAHTASTAAESKFVGLAAEIFTSYLERLLQSGDDDFDGLMQRASEAIAAGSTAFLRKGGGGDVKALRFVCIDEFQDFSELFYGLVDAMRKVNGRLAFCCVGDDWQAINGFAGSELRFFEKFPDYFEDSSKLHISTNYRSAKRIVEVGNDLMMSLGTPARASKQEAGDAWVCDMTEFEPTLIEKQRHPGDLITPLAARLAHRFALDGRSVVFLARRNGIPWYFNTGDDKSAGRSLDDFLQRVRSCLPEDLRGMASISTAHKYKGLERTVVVVLDAVARSYPLIHPDWPFFRIFGDSPMSLSQDDRRLFYVALTRAVESLVVITDSGAQSPFLEEIRAHRAMSLLPWKSFPPVADGGNRRLLLKIKDAADRKYGTQTGTFPIKGLLHACTYQYHGVAKHWEKSIAENMFKFDLIKAESWAVAAMDVEANFYDESERLLASYNVDRGHWAVVVDSWDLMRRLVADATGTASYH